MLDPRGCPSRAAISRRRTDGDVARELGHERLVGGERGIQDVTALPAGTADDEHLDTLVHVARHRRRALARLVVGVGVHGKQPQRSVKLRGSSVTRSFSQPPATAFARCPSDWPRDRPRRALRAASAAAARRPADAHRRRACCCSSASRSSSPPGTCGPNPMRPSRSAATPWSPTRPPRHRSTSRKPRDRAVACEVRALDKGMGLVGTSRVVATGAGKRVRVDVTIPTTARAFGVRAGDCVLE